MKKYILILGLFVTSLAFSQGGYTRPPVTTTAINVTIADAGAIITATEVENALQENRTLINLNTIPHLEFNNTDKTVWNNGKGNIDTNTSFGDFTLKSITTGFSNVAIGNYALGINTEGDQNTSVGMQSLTGNTTGDRNTAIGMFSLSANISGKENTASGLSSLQNNETGDYNVGFGRSALQNNTTGNYNVSIGWKSGAFTNGLVGDNVTPQNSIFIGASTESLTNNDTNQIVIGYDADGQGTNTVVLGNDDITDTYLKGNINGGAFIKDGGLSTEFLKADGSVSTGAGLPYKIYTALISQTSTNAPTVIVLENTLSGAIVWTYDSIGTYIGTLVGAFIVDKVFALTSGGFGLIGQNVTLVKSTNDTILLNSSSNSGTKTDGLLAKAHIEIRVYN